MNVQLGLISFMFQAAASLLPPVVWKVTLNLCLRKHSIKERRIVWLWRCARQISAGSSSFSNVFFFFTFNKNKTRSSNCLPYWPKLHQLITQGTKPDRQAPRRWRLIRLVTGKQPERGEILDPDSIWYSLNDKNKEKAFRDLIRKSFSQKQEKTKLLIIKQWNKNLFS